MPICLQREGQVRNSKLQSGIWLSRVVAEEGRGSSPGWFGGGS